jgi:hypothetical protein
MNDAKDRNVIAGRMLGTQVNNTCYCQKTIDGENLLRDIEITKQS